MIFIDFCCFLTKKCVSLWLEILFFCMEYYIIIGVVGIVVLLVTVALVAHHVGKGKVESQLAIANKEKELLGQRLAEL